MAILRRSAMMRRIVIITVCVLTVFCYNSLSPNLKTFGDFLERNEEFHNYQSFPGSRRLLAESDNETCIPAAVEQFPRPFMPMEMRRHGGIVIHICLALFMFLGLAVICDEYFVPSLERICDALRLQPDVAGATFMAAGSSAPELATAVIAVFITEDDIGLGTVVGSAVFNIMFVIGICALYTAVALHLDWWPLSRDCFFYLISIIVLLITIYDEVITWYESLVFLLLYIVYCIVMYFNPSLEEMAKKLLASKCKCNDNEKSRLVAYNKVDVALSESDVDRPSQSSLPTGESDDSVSSLKLQKEEEEYDIFRCPDGFFYRFLWMLALPLSLVFYITVPDCRKQRWRRWFLVTFFMSVLWVSVLSYFLVWMITVIGFTLHIPDTVMGLTFLAAGVSVPDAFASLLVIKDGLGDMAVSNAIGSNVFDILICLGLPWFLQTMLIHPNSTVQVRSKGLTYSTISLFSTVIFLLVAVHCNRWKLNKPLGVALMIWYLLFMILASLYELNVLGQFNPPPCSSNY